MHTKNEIRKIAERVHKDHKLSFPVNIELLCKKLHIDLDCMPIEDDVSGMIVMGKDSSAAIIINGNHHPNRQRFTGAHELGHYYLHYKSGLEFIDHVRYRRSLDEPSTKPDQAEIEANYFAAELLMPRFEVERAISRMLINVFDDGEVADLARYFGVSMQAMAVRLNTLGYIPDWAML